MIRLLESNKEKPAEVNNDNRTRKRFDVPHAILLSLLMASLIANWQAKRAADVSKAENEAKLAKYKEQLYQAGLDSDVLRWQIYDLKKELAGQ